jgi:hypothetical protein
LALLFPLATLSGIRGIAMAENAGVIVVTLVLGCKLRPWGTNDLPALAVAAARLLVASGATGAAAFYGAREFLGFGRFAAIVGGGTIGVLVFACCGWFLRLSGIARVTKVVLSRGVVRRPS